MRLNLRRQVCWCKRKRLTAARLLPFLCLRLTSLSVMGAIVGRPVQNFVHVLAATAPAGEVLKRRSRSCDLSIYLPEHFLVGRV